MARGCRIWQGVKNMASELAIYYTPMHFMWGVKSGATPGCIFFVYTGAPVLWILSVINFRFFNNISESM